jgi:predicted ATP-grasp superfamily ATP-dependent carboligase
MQRITALVTNAHHPTGLGAAQALAASGADVMGFSHTPDAWCCRSRAWGRMVALEDPEPATVLEAVRVAAEQIDGPVFLLPTGDRIVQEVSRRRACLPDHVRMTLPEDAVVQLLMEKTRFARWAQERGYPVPRSVIATSREGLEAALDRLRFPLLLKPTVKTGPWQSASPVDKALRLEGPDDLAGVDFDLFAAAPAYLISEWIPGADHDVLFCLVYLDERSEVVASFTGRKLLQYPRLTGSTAICVDRPDAELEELTARLFKEAGCRGLASLEVKRSAHDGRYVITEPTVGRPNLQSGAAVLGGVNLHGIAMRHAWDRDWSDLVGRRRRCLWIEERALFSVMTGSNGISRHLGLVARKALAGRRIGGAYFRVGDASPFTSMTGDWLRRRTRKLLHRPGSSRPSEAPAE